MADRLLAHLLLRYLSKWGLSVSRLAALVRGVLFTTAGMGQQAC